MSPEKFSYLHENDHDIVILFNFYGIRVFGHDVNSKVDEFLEYRETQNYGIGTYPWIVIGGLIIAWFVRKRKLRISGQHKKEDVVLDRFSHGKYRDS